jgi:quercetin dioxygenase-like cupin family protein
VKDGGMQDIQRGLKAVQPEQGRTFLVLGERITHKITGDDTGGGFAVIEISTPPQVGPPLHVHQREDEGLYVLEGMYEIRVGGRMIPAPPGACIFLPRDIPHTYTNVGYRTGKLLVTITPAGFEDFFDELSLRAPGPSPDRDTFRAIAQHYGLEIL